ncbi:MAG: transcriptional regulator [Limosilactobacillus sp.]|nr:transcriptional regulator [Limosilactobacillus sp.]
MLERQYPIRHYHVTSAADTIKELMEYHQITQQDLAVRLGVSQKHISELLHRKRFLSPVLAKRLELVMGLSAEFLLRRDLNYRLAQAQHTFTQIEHPTDQFLQPYDWVERS